MEQSDRTVSKEWHGHRDPEDSGRHEAAEAQITDGHADSSWAVGLRPF